MYKFPYGIADFKTIRQEGYFYIDRTEKIKEIEKVGNVITFLRPRRSGKSLLIDTLKNYYDVNEKENFDKLFSKLTISKAPTERMGRYLILNFDFSKVSAYGGVEEIVKSFGIYCNECFKDFYMNYKHLLNNQIEISPHFFSSLDSLFRCVRETEYKICVLIDEYDNFMNEIMVRERREDYERLVTGEGILKTFFKNLKASYGSVIDRIFITGISPIVLNDISSGFNISEDITFRKDFNNTCGFLEKEIRQVVESIIDEKKLEKKCEEVLQVMRKYYNGYCFSTNTKQKIYNPTLSLYFLKIFQDTEELPEEMLDKNLQSDINKLNFLCRIELGRKVIFEILENNCQISVSKVVTEFQLKDLLELEKQNEDYIASIMLYFGLLTIKEKRFNLLLEIPNNVCKRLYFEKLQNLISSHKLTTTSIQEEFFLNCNVNAVCRYLEDNILEVLSNRDYMHTNELAYKLLFLTVLYRDDIYFIESEKELFRDYCDLFFQVRPDMNQYGAKNILIEFKYVKLGELGMKGEAVKACEDKNLWNKKEVRSKYDEAVGQLSKYEKDLNKKYPDITIYKIVVIGLGVDRVIGKVVLHC